MSEESTGVATEEKAVTPDADSLESTTVTTPVDEEVNTPSNDTADTAETIDMNDVLSVPSTPEERGGLSRKEYKRQQEQLEVQVSESQDDDRVIQLEAQIAELRETFSQSKEHADYLRETREQVERSRIEQQFHNTLKEKGVDAATFNAQYKDAFKEEQQDLVNSGLSLSKATEKALKITLASYQADAKVKDTEERAEGRAKATIPPSSTESQDKAVYSEAQVAKLPQAEYNRVMELKEKGLVTITR